MHSLPATFQINDHGQDRNIELELQAIGKHLPNFFSFYLIPERGIVPTRAPLAVGLSLVMTNWAVQIVL